MRRAVVGIAIPLGLLLFCWLTMGVSAAVDRGVVNVYGFPMAWYAPSLVSSGEYEVALGPMLLDLCVYLFVAWGLVAAGLGRRWFALAGKVRRILTVGLWVVALGSMGASGLMLFGNSAVTGWRLNSGVPDAARRSSFLTVGIQPRPFVERRK